MTELRFAMFGAGFWANYQLAAWGEIPGVRCVAICDPDRERAERLGRKYSVASVHDKPEAVFEAGLPDFVDVVSAVHSHEPLVRLASGHGVPLITQKPMATSLAEAEELVSLCRAAHVPFLVHENWRWQSPLRRIREILDSGAIGAPFRARIDMISGFPVFVNQPALRTLEQFLLLDMGSHILDLARFLFGEAKNLYCHTRQVHADIRGEDVATVMMRMGENHTSVVCQMAFAENALEHECFPQTFVFIEGDRGSLELAPDYWVRVTTEEGTVARRHAPPRFAWADPAYEVVHASLVPCLVNLLEGIKGGAAETTAEDNVRTVRLIFAAYESAKKDRVIRFE
jgi:predicted dehydrogenase